MKKYSEKGFMLIEILVSLLVFSIGVLFLIQTLSVITQSNQQLRDNYSAMLLIDNLLNRLYAQEAIPLSGIESVQGKDFSWQIDQSTTLEGLKQIDLLVKWHSKGRDYTASLEHQTINPE